MKQTRKGFFETNSSSTHSISLGGDDLESIIHMLRPQFPGIQEGDTEYTINLAGYVFGWEIETYNDAEIKLAYALLDYAPDYQIVQDVFKEITGVELVVKMSEYDNNGYTGYIDHQSRGTATELSREELINFIFNPHSELHTDNDNHQ